MLHSRSLEGSGVQTTNLWKKRFRTCKQRHLVQARPKVAHSSSHPLHCLLRLRLLLVLFAVLHIKARLSLPGCNTV